jgi:4-aminobutyrate aminotransferase-like enzyme/Ser/Thr protein kinase RdoA (MazF antagonist)
MAISPLQQAPRLEPADAESLTRDLFGIAGAARPLPSERDQNFVIDAGGRRFVLKIANAGESYELLDAQNAAMSHLAALDLCPRVMPAADGRTITQAPSGHWIRLLTWVEGVPLGALRRQSLALFEHIGRRLGDVDRALSSFDHPSLHRDFRWDLAAGLRAVHEHAPFIDDPALRRLVEPEAARIQSDDEPRFDRLRRSAIHNDANDYNVLAGGGQGPFDRCQRMVGLIDFGDIIHSFTVADLAVAAAYAVLGKPDPLAIAAALVRGYHSVHALTEDEIASLLPLVKLRLCMSAAIAAHNRAARPDDPYLAISQDGVRETLPRLIAIPPRLAEAVFRQACGLDPVPHATRVVSWLQATKAFPVVDMATAAPTVVDLSVSSPLVSGDPLQNAEPMLTARIDDHLRGCGTAVGLGRYGEARLLYSSPMFEVPPARAVGARATAAAGFRTERRTVHLGIDVFAPVGTPIRVPLAGVVHAFADNASPLDYGPVVILRHTTGERESFFTLYGHLTRESLATLQVGQPVESGDIIGAIGSAAVNGGWTPHLHVQLITDLFDLGCDFPGVSRASDWDVWSAFSPNPAALLGEAIVSSAPSAQQSRPSRAGSTADSRVASASRKERDTLLAERRQRLGRNLSVGYRQPLTIVRGWMQYLFDETGRRLLDGYNNVPHVGHCHPRVFEAVARQSRVLNTNTRYLHESLVEYAARLTATLPDPLRVCYFVNSGTEANELALRLARTHTRRHDVIVLDAAYHGNSTTTIDISPYKFNGPGGGGRKAWVHVVPLPDVYRGKHPREGAGRAYARDVADVVDALFKRGSAPAAFIAETCPSVGGQIVLPPGYLASVYECVRGAGGVCIADEVQTAYGRMGTSFYAFEDQQVVPDIVVLGKPIGNGYPIGAVVTSEPIAASFDNGMEFFSTFGGSTVSCAAGLAVLDVVRDEGLQAHASQLGEHLFQQLRRLGESHPLVGDVRGSGLFAGVELVRDRQSLEPAREEADYVVNRLRDEGVLIGTDGPYHNVLKIRPPMPFDRADADLLVSVLREILEDLTA